MIQASFNERRDRTRLRASKLERVHQLCQLVFDGHKREVSQARYLLPEEVPAFKKERKHPGAEMSELKFLMRAYAPALKGSLAHFDAGHRPLKASFAGIDGLIATRGELTEEEFAARSVTWDHDLPTLGEGCQELKTKIADVVGKLVC